MSEILKIKAMLKRKEISQNELFSLYLKKAKTENDRLNAYITLCDESEENKGPLSGIPIAVKDNISTKGVLTTCGSEMLSDYIPFYSAYAAKKLFESGAVLLGKTNMDEFAMGSTGETSFFGPCKNTLDLSRVSGGSSSGSAAAVASGTAALALGTDTGGSVRLPAAYCGVVGLAPTYSLVSRYGLIAYASSLDRIGIIAKDSVDTAIALDIISSHDEKDATNSIKKYDSSIKDITSGVSGMKIGILEDWLKFADGEIVQAVLKAAHILEIKGAKIFKIKYGDILKDNAAYKIISCMEASSNLLRYDGVRYGKRETGADYEEVILNSRSSFLGEEVKKRILFGCFVSSLRGEKYKIAAENVRKRARADFESMFSQTDAVLAPVVKSLPPLLGAESDPESDIFTVPASLSGNPAVSVPLDTMIGVQIIGRHFGEKDILRVAHALEEAL